MMPQEPIKHKIVIVGGGAGGLELATRLGKKLGKKHKADITLVDETSTHVWKPLLHEVAAGSLDSNIDQINYYAHASNHDYHFQPGKMIDLDRERKMIMIAPLLDEQGEEIIPARTLHYDSLIFAVGSRSNNFGVSGVSEFCLTIDDLEQANVFQKKYLNKILSINYFPNSPPKPLNIVIVGAGATGVELAAELHHSLTQVQAYELDNSAIKLAQITLIESSNRILSGLPEGVADSVCKKMQSLGMNVYTNTKVIQVQANGLHTEKGQFIPADLCVWAAGIKAPDFLNKIAGLETDPINRLMIKPTLQTTRDESIFALGDCAHLIDPNTGFPMPARAQTAHQQASFLADRFNAEFSGHKPEKVFQYRDRGSIVALACYGAYGHLTSFAKIQHFISGKVALYTYRSLYFYHLATLYGFWPALWLKRARKQLLKVRPRLKLHFSKY
ncbi:TPA: NAD(P)/FAD-dependent oxidoreductase [Legionella feeleii]